MPVVSIAMTLSRVGSAHAAPLMMNVPLSVSEITYERFNSFDAVLDLRAEWDALVEQTGGDLFASFDWCLHWWKHFGRNRSGEFLIARANGQLIACLPLFRETLRFGPLSLRVVRLVGSDSAGTRCHLPIRLDFLDIVMRELAARTHDGGLWDVLFLGDLPGDFEPGRSVAEALHKAFPESSVVFRAGHYPQALFDVPDDFEEYLRRLSSNERGGIRRTERNLQTDHRPTIEWVGLDQLDEAMDDFVRQHETWWSRIGRLGYFRDWPGSLAFHRDICRVQLQNNRLLLLRMRKDSDAIGYHYSHQFFGRIHWFQASRSDDARWDEYSVGRRLHCENVRAAIARGVRQIDGLSGHYDFKIRWGARYARLQSIAVVSPRGASLLRTRLFTAAVRAHAYAYNRVWFWHLAPWLRLRLPEALTGVLCRGQAPAFIRRRFLDYSLRGDADDAIILPASQHA